MSYTNELMKATMLYTAEMPLELRNIFDKPLELRNIFDKPLEFDVNKVAQEDLSTFSVTNAGTETHRLLRHKYNRSERRKIERQNKKMGIETEWIW